MPALDHIQLHPADLQQLCEALRQLRHNATVEIFDTCGTITVRDANGMFLTEIKRFQEEIAEDT